MRTLNPSAWRRRAELKRKARSFFHDRDYLEVETPHMVDLPTLEPHLDPYGVSAEEESGAHLITSPEIGLKKVLGQGMERIYEFAHSYRSAERSPWHSREFVMLEWYRVGCVLEQCMDEVEAFLALFFPDLPPRRFTLEQWFREHLDLPLEGGAWRERLVQQGVEGVDGMDEDECFFRLFLPTESILESMGLVLLSHYPQGQCSYAEVESNRALRFEVYAKGVELANAYQEERSPVKLRSHMEKERSLRSRMKKNPLDIDEDFVHALEGIEKPICGIALGWDRLVALEMGQKDLLGSSPFPGRL